MARQVWQTHRGSPGTTKGTSTENNLEKDPRDADRDNAQVKNCEGDAQGKRRKRDAQINEDLVRLLEKLAGDKRVIQEKGAEEPEVTILRRKADGKEGSSKERKPDGREVVQSLVDRIPEDVLEMTMVRKKMVALKKEAEDLGLGQESGERDSAEEDAEEENLSGECEEWDEDSEKSNDDQDSLCMILAEEKMRHRDRELQMGPSSGTYNLDQQ